MKNPGKRAWRRHPARWMAFGALAAYVAASGKAHAAARAQQAQPADTGQSARQELSVQRFHIPAGPLDAALLQFHAVTGIEIRYTLPGASVAGFHSQGAKGLITNRQALRQLLAGTGLAWSFSNPDTVSIGIHARESVYVTGPSIPDSLPLAKFSQPLLETPQTIHVVPLSVIEQEGVSTLRDTLRNVPGISLAAGEAGAQGDNLTIRGFSARNDMFLDGIRDFGSYYRDAFDYQQVDVLEGPAAVDFGRGSTGGVINQETKQPGLRQFMNFHLQLGNAGARRGTADISRPLPKFADGTSFRLNLMGEEAGVSERDYAEARRFGVAPSLSLGMNSRTPVTLSYFHLTERDTPDYGIPWLFNKPAAVPRSNYYGFARNNYLNTDDDIVTLKVDHLFAPSVAFTDIARWANYPRDVQITEPQICSNSRTPSSLPTDAYNSNLPCPYSPDSDPDSVMVNRNQIQVKSVEGDLWDQANLSLDFKAAGLRHELLLGAEGGQEFSNPIRSSYTIGGINTVPPTSLLNPKALQPWSGEGYILSIVHAKAQSIGLYFLDTVHLSRFFDLSGGVRWDRFAATYNIDQPPPPPGGRVTSTKGAPYHRVDRQPSYRAALVFKPGTHGSIYFDYGTSFNPSAESLSLSEATQNVAPEQNQTFEAGTKWSLLHGHMNLDAAIFRTEKDNARETSPTDSSVVVLAGNEAVKGVQLGAIANLPGEMSLIAGYAYLDSAVISSPFYPWSVGYPLSNVPTQTANLFVTHSLPWRLHGGIGGNYVGSRTASSVTPVVPITKLVDGKQVVVGHALKQAPGYWVLNAMLRRPISDKLEFQVNVDNLLNRSYIDLPHPSHVIPGAGITALIGLNLKF